MNKVTGAYFSPTGGTKRAAEQIVSQMTSSPAWVELGQETSHSHIFTKDEWLVLALPVYAGQIPVVPELLDGLIGNQTPCILVAAYGNRHYDHALAQMKRKMTAQGFRCIGAAAVITPHIFAPTLGTGRPDKEDMEQLDQFIQQVKRKYQSPTWEDVVVPGDPNPPPHPAVPVPKERDLDICLGCGFCAKVCPTKAMDVHTLQWDIEKCISCMACVSHCPVGALSYCSAPLASRLTQNFSQRRSVEVFL